MRALHIVQGGVENGDKEWLETAARQGLPAKRWVVPRGVAIGDDVVLFIRGHGFFATARISSTAKPRADWRNRYGAGLTNIKLIRPALSLPLILRAIPELSWAKYPRSITTPPTATAEKVRQLIRNRRQAGVAALEEGDLEGANLDELRAVALLKSRRAAPVQEHTRRERLRSLAVHQYVLRRALGRCEACGSPAPFVTSDGTPYLESHHTTRVADGGPDHPAHVIALCPNCHRRAHSSGDRAAFNRRCQARLARIEPHD